MIKRVYRKKFDSIWTFYHYHSLYGWLLLLSGEYWTESCLDRTSEKEGVSRFSFTETNQLDFLLMTGQTLDKTLEEFERRKTTNE